MGGRTRGFQSPEHHTVFPKHVTHKLPAIHVKKANMIHLPPLLDGPLLMLIAVTVIMGTDRSLAVIPCDTFLPEPALSCSSLFLQLWANLPTVCEI